MRKRTSGIVKKMIQERNIINNDLFMGFVFSTFISVLLLEIALRLFVDFLPFSFEKIPLRKDEMLFWNYRCKGDDHFCEDSNRWLTGEIFRSLISGKFVGN